MTAGLSVFLEVFWKSGVVLAAGLCASALLRRRSADVRRLALSTSVAALFVAAVLVPMLPRWTAAAPAWLQRASSVSPAPAHRPVPPAVPDGTAPLLPPLGPAAANQPASHPLPIRIPAIPLIWLAGTTILLARFLVGLRALRRLRTASQVLSDNVATPDLRRRVSLRQSDSIDAPITWGIVRPVILVPAGFEELQDECRRQVLCHELGHIQGQDFLLRVLVEIARAAIWFQPLMWITRRQLREEQELACDNRVLASGGRSSAYAKLLLDWDGGLRGNGVLIAVGMAQPSCLKRRLYALLDLDTRRETVSRAAVATTWLLGLATVLPLAAFDLVPGRAPFQRAEAAPKPVVVERPAVSVPAPAPVAAPQLAAAKPAPEEVAPADAVEAQADAEQPPVPDSQVVFEVATVKHGAPGDYGVKVTGGPGTGDPTRWTIENYPTSSLLEMAYGINSYQLSGPKWLDDERFTVNAKLPEGTTKEQAHLMLRNLLMERFKLAVHFEKKDVAGYQLIVAKGGPKLADSSGDPAKDPDAAKAAEFKWGKVDAEGYPELPPGRTYAMSVNRGRARWRFGDESMEHFAGILGGQIRQPIINATGLTGKYDFTFFWSYEAMQPNAPADAGPTIYAAIQEQLGLKLESRKVPVDLLMVDHIEKSPTEN